jgi:glutathione peroxidase
MSILKNIITKFYGLRMKLSKHTGMGISISSNKEKIKAPVSFYSIEAKANNGEIIGFEKFRGKKIMLVNLASKCGFTPQYNDLEKLHNLYKDNVTILGFPSDDFGGQEPGSDEEIAEFCRINFGVTFQLFHKDHVKGNKKQPAYQWLCDATKNGWNNEEPAWNFCKYLVDENGDLINFYSSAVSPLSDEIIKTITA